MPPDDLIQLLPSLIEDGDWLEDRRQKLLFSMARAFERLGDLATACKVYLDCRYRGARTRAIRLTSRRHDWAATHALCLRAQETREGKAEFQYVRRVLPLDSTG